MPSVTDLQQQSSKISSNNNGKSSSSATAAAAAAPQQQINPTSTGSTTDTTNVDPIIQAVLMLEKKQRNLGKRKEKLESYEELEKTGKELNKDQKEALAKYSEVLGQIECAKDISEQLKKIQVESAKSQKRLLKQAAEEKRLLTVQRVREYAQLRYLLDHRPSSLKPEESSLLDEIARVVIPSDVSLNTINRSIDAVLSIYQGGQLSSTIKNLTGRTSQEIREILEQLIKQCETFSSSIDTATTQQTQVIETVRQTPTVVEAPSTTSVSVLPQREQSKQQQQQSNNNNNDVIGSSLSHTNLIQTISNEYPLQFDTRNQNIPLHKIIEDSPFFSLDSTTTNNNQQDSSNNQDNNQTQTNDQEQILQTFTVLNSALTGQTPSQGFTQATSQQQGGNNYDQETSNVVNSTDEQQSEEQWQQRHGNVHRGGQFNGNVNRNYHRGGQNSNNQQNWRGPRGGHYDNSYGSGQRRYNESNTRGGGGGYRGGPNPNYRGNRGGSYRGGNRGGNDNGHQQSGQHQQNTEQQQVHSAPASRHQ